jgi:hypothetical protein
LTGEDPAAGALIAQQVLPGDDQAAAGDVDPHQDRRRRQQLAGDEQEQTGRGPQQERTPQPVPQQQGAQRARESEHDGHRLT